MSDTLSFSGTKSKTATTAADPSLLAAPPMHSTLTPTEEAWLERLGLQGGSGNPTIPVDALAEKLIEKLGSKDRQTVLGALEKAGLTDYAQAVKNAVESLAAKEGSTNREKEASVFPPADPAPDPGAAPGAKLDVVVQLDGKKAEEEGRHNVAALYPKVKELKGPATRDDVQQVIAATKSKVETTDALPPHLRVSGKAEDSMVSDELGFGSTPVAPAMVDTLSTGLTEKVVNKVKPLHVEQEIEVISADARTRLDLIKAADFKGPTAWLERLATGVQAWKDPKARDGFDLLLKREPGLLWKRLQKLDFLKGEAFDVEQPQLLTFCRDAFVELINPEAKQTKLAVVGDVHGSEESIADRISLAAHDKEITRLMGLVKKGDEAAALDILRNQPDVAQRFLDLAVQFTGDLTSKGTGTHERFAELMLIDRLRQEAKLALTGKVDDEGVGFVFGNHEFSLAMFLRAPDVGMFNKFFGSWLLEKQGYQLLESAVDDGGFLPWITAAGLNGKSYAEMARSDALVPGTDRKFKDVDAELQGLQSEPAKKLLASDKKAVVGWAYMKYSLYDPNRGGKMGEFLFDRHARLLQLQQVGDRLLLFSHGDLSRKLIDELGSGLDETKGQAFNQEVLRKNVDKINGEFRDALIQPEEAERTRRLRAIEERFARTPLFKLYFNEFYHAGEGGAKNQTMEDDFKYQMDFLALAGVSGHFSGHTPQVAQSGTQTKAQHVRKIQGVDVVVDDYKIDIDEFGEGGAGSGNVVTVDAEGSVFGHLRDEQDRFKLVRLGHLAGREGSGSAS